MPKKSNNAAVLWTGGKDSCLALYEAKLLGYEIASLVTFIPEGADFLAHPLDFMQYQAEALGLPHSKVKIHEPFKDGYEKAIHVLREEQGIGTLITGDIAEVEGYPNWIRECSRNPGVDVLTPLWGRDRREILNRLLSSGFKVIFSCVKSPWFTLEWVGRELDWDTYYKLCEISAETGLDICGEQGEYHTLALDGPPFKSGTQIKAYKKRATDSLMYMEHPTPK